MQETEQIVDSMMKGECYRWIAACFYPPKKELFVEENFLATLTENLRHICPAAATFSQVMAESLVAYTDEELNVAYAKLFVGPFQLQAPPYGSIYLDNEGTVMGPSTLETIRFYEEEGLARDPKFNELPDHIAVELEFMYFLVFKQIEAFQKGESERAQEYKQKQQEFLSRFLSKWSPQFCSNIKNETDNKFYISLADCLNTLITYVAVPHVLTPMPSCGSIHTATLGT